jgi:transposase InsO family protein
MHFPLDVWQMDVTHIPAFGKLQYVHVSINTSSGVLHASPLTGEKAVHVISHCLEAWTAWGKPLVLKTDNRPAYTSSKFSQFCKQMQVKHITGLPYNPQSQGIIERAHLALKQYLQIQKGGIEAMTPKMALSLTIFLPLIFKNWMMLGDHQPKGTDNGLICPMKWSNGKMFLIINGMARITY